MPINKEATPEKISFRLTKTQREWLDTKGNKSAYITGLIDEDIKSSPEYSEWEITEDIYLDKKTIFLKKGEIVKLEKDYVPMKREKIKRYKGGK